MGVRNSDWPEENKHPACDCGCGELADECPRGSWVKKLGRPATCWCGMKMVPRDSGRVGCPQHFDNVRSS